MNNMFLGNSPLGTVAVDVTYQCDPVPTQGSTNAVQSGGVYDALEEVKEYTDQKIAAISTPDVSGQINTHNVAADAHADIREAIEVADKVFMAKYGVTSGNTIYKHLNAGHVVVLQVNDNGCTHTAVQSGIADSDSYYFYDLTSNIQYVCSVDSGGDTSWYIAGSIIPTTPDDIGAPTVAEMNTAIASALPSMTKVTLSVNNWSTDGEYTVSVEGILADETAQIITVAPTTASIVAATESGIYCSGQGANSLTFTCTSAPTSDIKFLVSWQDAKWVEPPVALISFSIGGDVELKTYQAEEGMTWAEWVDSDYNTYGNSITFDQYGTYNEYGYILFQYDADENAYREMSTSVIIDGTEYKFIY